MELLFKFAGQPALYQAENMKRKPHIHKYLQHSSQEDKATLPKQDKAALSHEDRVADWKFYGRKEQLADLERMLDRKRWFFAKVTGRRRLGKTTLIQQAMAEGGYILPQDLNDLTQGLH
jgi:hypothetical protein